MCERSSECMKASESFVVARIAAVLDRVEVVVRFLQVDVAQVATTVARHR